ncbi:MAG: peptidase and in kexin sedolisin [Streptosporangiaceae bacterium]|nr:peptidase and in kexin sedolisin [Streptosporangiaceae bacterium]
MSDAGRRRPGQARTRAGGICRGLTVKAASAAIAFSLVAAAAGPLPAAPAPAAGLRAAAAATDLIRGREWWLTALHAPNAWKWSRGRGVTVAVLDTGVDARHADLAGQVLAGEDFTGGIRRPGNKYWGRHGTAMASIIAGHGHGPGMTEGVIGIAPQAKILSIRVTWENDDPERESSAEVNRSRDAVAKGIRYAVDHGAGIINMSLGGGKQFYNGNPTEEEAIRYALSKGVVLIASAGNDGASLNRKNFPAAYPGVIAVGAVDKNMLPWRDSNRHPYVRVAAPGVEIVSADAGGGYVLGTGTSPSAAIVAGIAALIRARYPELTSVQIADAMAQGADPSPSGVRSAALGAGITDAVKAMYAAYRLSKPAYDGQAVAPPPAAPQTAPQTATRTGQGGAGLLFVGALAAGGTLVVIGLVLGRRRRRRSDEVDDHEELGRWPDEPAPAAAHPLSGAGMPIRPQDPHPVQPWQRGLGPVPPKAPADESWRTRRSPEGRVKAAGLPGASPDEQPTGVFRAVPSWPDEQPTGTFRAVPAPPDEQPTGTLRAVRSSPDELPTTAFRAVAPRPDAAAPRAAGGRSAPLLPPAQDEGHRLPWS